MYDKILRLQVGGLAGIVPGIYSVDDVNETYNFCQEHINQTDCMEELFWEGKIVFTGILYL